MLNLNIGLLGHVDSGKTTLAKSLSAIASTAAFDKSPQSQNRGITLDLGFSALQTEVPDRFKYKYDKLQITFVDCPGHASLIKTIIGGAQIIDVMILVVDVFKGIQTQTAECLVIGELTCKKMIVALNKIDLIDPSKKKSTIEKMLKRIKLSLSSTVFSNCSIIEVSALNSENLNNLIEVLKEYACVPERDVNAPLLFAVDHCFAIKGQGTVCTGTVLQGMVKINDDIEIPKLKLVKKVKTIQMFKKPAQSAVQGDRIGICITQFEPSQLERGLLCTPGYVSNINAAIIKLNRIKYYKGAIKNKSKFHMSCGYETVMANITLFSSKSEEFDWKNEYEFIPELDPECQEPKNIFVLLEFEKSIQSTPKSLVIASKLDADIHTNACRLAFWGHLNAITCDKNYQQTFLPNLKIYKEKLKTGNIQRVINESELIVSNLFKKEGNNRQIFVGLKVNLTSGETGVIEDTFGASSKVKLRLSQPLAAETIENIKKHQKDIKVELKFKKFVYSKNNKIVQ